MMLQPVIIVAGISSHRTSPSDVIEAGAAYCLRSQGTLRANFQVGDDEPPLNRPYPNDRTGHMIRGAGAADHESTGFDVSPFP